MRFRRTRRGSTRPRGSRPDELACRAAVALMTDYLDGALSALDADRLETHLAGCLHCTEYLRQLEITVDLAGSTEPVLDETTTQALAALYRQWRGR